MTKEEALKQTLEAFEALVKHFSDVSAYEDEEYAFTDELIFIPDIKKAIKAIAAAKETLAQPEQSVAGYCKKTEELIAERDRFSALAKDNGHVIIKIACELADVKKQRDDLLTAPLPEQEPEYWNVIDPAGNIVASETDAIRGWARIAGSYKPTVEGLLGFHDQGWRVLPKVAPTRPEQEPVARVIDNGTPEGSIEWIPFTNRVEPLKTGDLLYTTTPRRTWVGLTDEDMTKIDQRMYPTWKDEVQAIEARLKELNNG